jgi:hypothetical protein
VVRVIWKMFGEIDNAIRAVAGRERVDFERIRADTEQGGIR